jgi:ATP-dependent RNA helicase RhlE
MKRNLLAHLLRHKPDTQALVFVDTKLVCGRLAHFLERSGISADAIHGDKSQQQRTETLETFKNGKLRVLVATDVAARGLDIDELPYVINFELPHTAEDYVHRIGRTGRAGHPGNAVSLVCAEEKYWLAEIQKLIRFEIPQEVVPGFDPDSDFFEAGSRSSRRRPPGGTQRSAVTVAEAAAPRTGAKRRTARPTVAADGFDFSKPYEPSTDTLLASGEPGARVTRAEPLRRPQRPIAVLLGGLGRRPDAPR